jgi:pilus assembly protein CpaE
VSASAYETVRILLVSSQEELHNQVVSALQDRLANHRVYWASQADTAMRRADELMPNLIVVSNDLPRTPMGQLIRDLAAHAPAAAILVLIEPSALEVASQAMLAGARGFVVKPITQPDDFVASVRTVLRQEGTAQQTGATTPQQLGRVIVFCAPKGGTGRTTLAINTAVGLHIESHGPVVLVDADFAAPALDVALNLQPERTIADLLPRMARLDAELIMGVLAKHASGIHVLLAPPPSELSSSIPLPQVQQVVTTLRRSFDWIVVDLGLPMNETAYAFLDSADRIVISVLPEMVGLRNARVLLDGLHERGYPEAKVRLVVNRSNMSGGVKPRDIEARLKLPVGFTVPDDSPLATHAINRGVPALISHRRSVLGKSYRQFVRKLIQDLPLTPAGEQESELGRSLATAGAPADELTEKALTHRG